MVSILVWLDRKYGNRTFYSNEYDPDFNLDEVKELLNEPEETQDAE